MNGRFAMPIDVGPRDGFQSIGPIIPTAMKIALLRFPTAQHWSLTEVARRAAALPGALAWGRVREALTAQLCRTPAAREAPSA
jgi:hypothetical protein